jgi:hypothetical protein
VGISRSAETSGSLELSKETAVSAAQLAALLLVIINRFLCGSLKIRGLRERDRKRFEHGVAQQANSATSSVAADLKIAT